MAPIIPAHWESKKGWDIRRLEERPFNNFSKNPTIDMSAKRIGINPLLEEDEKWLES
jgi:hypothetical protein